MCPGECVEEGESKKVGVWEETHTVMEAWRSGSGREREGEEKGGARDSEMGNAALVYTDDHANNIYVLAGANDTNE